MEVTSGSVRDRAARLAASPAVAAKKDPREAPWTLAVEPPADLVALLSACDGLELEDGTRLLGREEIAPATRWLTEEKSLGWGEDLVVVGERDDLVIVRDLDRQGKRAGGGVLEAPTDGLESFQRVALDLVGYLEVRAGLGPDPRPAPEELLRRAVADKDAAMLARVLGEPLYPGTERAAAHAALVLGELNVASGDDVAAMRAFVRSVGFRAQAARQGAEALERAAAWRAAARVAEAAGAHALAESCLARMKV
jgi:hypothetical protein